MSDRYVNYDEVKRKTRKLKKLEIKIRFGHIGFADNKQELFRRLSHTSLVWDEFFDLHEVCKKEVKYSIGRLAAMDKDEFKNVVSEFFFNVYYRYYKENGIVNIHLYDPDILAQMGLPFDADGNAIKKRFRELAKQYHPDTGGDSTKFIELMENYKKLVD